MTTTFAVRLRMSLPSNSRWKYEVESMDEQILLLHYPESDWGDDLVGF